MIEKKLTLKNKLGLHARAAAKLVQVAEQYKSDIKILKDSVEADGKSILGVLLLAAPVGSELIFRIEGEDEEQAIKAIEELIDDKFGEDE